jgi:predicted phosphodiesterase
MSTTDLEGPWADVARVLLAGDTHADSRWIGYLCAVARGQGCPLIVQVGDFGYFPSYRVGRAFLDAAEHAGAEHDVHIAFIDGNHDDHHRLARRRGDGRAPAGVSAHVTHLPRGLRLDIGGRRFGFLGGAFSVDWRYRTEGRTWWPGETIEPADVERLGTDPLDVLVTHDAPAGIDLPSTWRLPPEDEARGLAQRTLVRRALDATTPRLAVHGHWHRRHVTELEGTRVLGLGCDGADDAWAVLDLHDLSVSALPLDSQAERVEHDRLEQRR